MPLGLVRTDLNKTGTSFRKGNPVTLPKNFGNPVTWAPASSHFGNPVPASDATFDSNPVTWAPSPAHFGNTIGPQSPPATFAVQGAADVVEGTASSLAITLPAPAVAHDSLYVSVEVDPSGLIAPTSVVDDLGVNVYSLVSGPDTNGLFVRMWLYKCENIVGTPQIVTVTFSDFTSGAVIVAAVSRSVGSPALNHFAFGITHGSTPDWTGPAVVASDNNLLLAFAGTSQGIPQASPGAGWTLIDQTNSAGNNWTFGEYRTADAGTYTPVIAAVGMGQGG